MTFLYRKPHFSLLSLCVACHIYRKTQPSNMLSWAMDPLLNNSLGVRKRKISEMKIFNTLVSPVLDCHGNQNEYTSVKVKSIDRTLLSYKLKNQTDRKRVLKSFVVRSVMPKESSWDDSFLFVSYLYKLHLSNVWYRVIKFLWTSSSCRYHSVQCF